MSRFTDEHASWRTLSSRMVASGWVSDFTEDIVETPDGEQIVRHYVTHPGAVAILALNEDDQVAVVRQYRHPAQMNLYEIPAGLLDVSGEDPLDAAKRELAEEAGLAAQNWNTLIDIFTTPGSSAELMRVYLALGLSPASRPEGFVAEGEEAQMITDWAPISQLHEQIMAGELHSPSLVFGVNTLLAARASGVKLRSARAPWHARI